MGIFPEGEDFRGDHGLGRLVEFMFKALLALHPPISSLASSGQRNRASWASQPQKSVTLLPCLGGKTTKSTRTCGVLGEEKKAIWWLYSCLQPKYVAVARRDTFMVHVFGVVECFGVNFRGTATANGSDSCS